MVKALDVAFSRISPEWARSRQAEGWQLLIQNVWTGGYANNFDLVRVARLNLRDWREAGGLTAIYTNAAPWRTPQLWFEESLKNAGGEFAHVEGVIIDHEIADISNNPPVVTDANMEQFIRLWQTTGKPIGLYSADWFVAANLKLRGLRIDWGLPYWYARYDGHPVVNPSEVRYPMGPVKAKQYAGTTRLDGVVVDLNEFDADYFGAREDEMTTEQWQQLMNKLEAIHGETRRNNAQFDNLRLAEEFEAEREAALARAAVFEKYREKHQRLAEEERVP